MGNQRPELNWQEAIVWRALARAAGSPAQQGSAIGRRVRYVTELATGMTGGNSYKVACHSLPVANCEGTSAQQIGWRGQLQARNSQATAGDANEQSHGDEN